MVKKVLASLLMGALVFMVGFFIIIYYMNSFELQQSQKEISVLNTLNLQKTCAVKKLIKRSAAGRNELNSVKNELESAKKALDGVNKELISLKDTLGKLSK